MFEIGERDGWTCHLCGGNVDRALTFPHPQMPTFDHIVPVSLGGPHVRDNVALAHFSCNSKRGAKVLAAAA